MLVEMIQCSFIAQHDITEAKKNKSVLVSQKHTEKNICSKNIETS